MKLELMIQGNPSIVSNMKKYFFISKKIQRCFRVIQKHSHSNKSLVCGSKDKEHFSQNSSINEIVHPAWIKTTKFLL